MVAGALVPVFMLVFLVSGCSTIDRWLGGGADDDADAGELMSQGNEDLSAGRYKDAVDAFQKIKDRYPYSRYAVSAELKMADAL